MKESKEYNLGILALILAIMVMALCFACLPGCKLAPHPVIDHTTSITTPITADKTEHAVIHNEHAAARSDLASVFKWTTTQPVIDRAVHSADQHIAVAETHTVAADKDNTAANVAAVAVGKADLAAQTENNALREQVNKLNSQFFSPRQKRDFWLFVISGALLAAAFGVLKGAAVGNPAIAIIRGAMLFVATFSMSGFHWLGHKLTDGLNWLHARHVAGAAAIATTKTTTTVASVTTSTPATGFVTGLTAAPVK